MSMNKVEEYDSPLERLCQRCQRYSHTPYLICAIHPSGPEGDVCWDFAPNAAAAVQERWQPVGVSFYDGDLIPDTAHYLTTEERLALIASHPLFTGRCPQCGAEFDGAARVHFDCDRCEWKDDTI
jgi:hypothetical protein